MMKGLNEQQLKAAEHDQGPLLIVAGAGTGKTKVVSSRIVRLISSGEVKSGEVLALTFTEKAAKEMLDRIELAMPLGYEEIWVKTFHAFADKLLRESGLEIGLDPGYKLLTQVEQWFFFKKHLFEFELDYYRPLGNPNRFIFDLLDHFSKLKDELISPEQYLEYAKKIDGEEGEKTLEIAKCYAKHSALMIKNNYLDFGDLAFYANLLFTKRDSVLQKYRAQFKYLMVDEFQDTNFSQFQLVLQLTEGHKNVVVVGDDDQSIYKWRGASISNILKFEEKFPNCKKVVLTENYRSSKNILDAAYELIKNNNPDRLEERIGIDKKLKSNIESNNKVEVHQFADFLQESEFVAKEIERLRQVDGCDYDQFAILVRANQLTHPFIDELKNRGIPYQVKNPKGLFALDEIKDLLAVVRVLANPRDDISLLRVLKLDVLNIEMGEILELLHKSGNKSLFEMLEYVGEPQLPGIESDKVDLHRIIKNLVEFSKKNSVGLVINEFLKESKLLNYLIENERFEDIENINEFAKQVAKFEKENVDRSVLDFVGYLDLLEEANAVFATDSFADRNSVQIITAHGSKGLEFDHVFVVNTVAQRFPSTRRRATFELPEELTNEIYPEGDFHLQEERRLFYVAMTRARKNLYLTYSLQYEGTKKWKQSPFVSEILKCDGVNFSEHEEKEDAVKRLKSYKEPLKPIFDLPPFTRKRLSYSQFDTFETCPLKYNYRYLMKVPSPMGHASNFGTCVHETLKEFYRALKNRKEVSLALMESLYDKNWIPYGYDSVEHEQERKKKGLDLLKDFHETNKDPWVTPAFLERPFNLKIGEHIISGRIDRIDKLQDGTYEVIDYKTGKISDKSLNKDLQLSIYALACRDILNLKVSKLSLYYLEGNKKVSTERSDDQLKAVVDEIDQLIKGMQNSDFAPTPGFHCQFCDFRIICPAV